MHAREEIRKLKILKVEIEEQKNKLQFEKELLITESSLLIEKKYQFAEKIETEMEELEEKRNNLEIEGEILEEMRCDLEAERQEIEMEAQSVFMTIAQLQEAKSAIVSGCIEDFIEITTTMQDVDMILSSDESRYTLLHWAVLYNQQEIVTELLKKGAKQIPNKEGYTPLDIARKAVDNGETSFLSMVALLTQNNDYTIT